MGNVDVVDPPVLGPLVVPVSGLLPDWPGDDEGVVAGGEDDGAVLAAQAETISTAAATATLMPTRIAWPCGAELPIAHLPSAEASLAESAITWRGAVIEMGEFVAPAALILVATVRTGGQR